MTAPRDPRLPDYIPPDEIETLELRPDNHKVVGPPPAPLTAEDLVAACRFLYPEEEAQEFAADLAQDIGEPGVFWSGNILLLVALLSDEHRERMRGYLKLTTEAMDAALAEVRKQIRFPR